MKLQWIKDILGDAYTEELDAKVSAALGERFVSRADFNAKNTRVTELETQVGKLVVTDDGMPVEEGDDGVTYTSYALGEGAIEYEDIGAKAPYEMARDPKTNGGQDTLYTRQRKVFAPRGISYLKKVQATLSPTEAELSNGQNWDLVHSGEAEEAQRSYIADKVITLCRIKSKG